MRGRGGRDSGGRSETGIGRIKVDREGGLGGTLEVVQRVEGCMLVGRDTCQESML